MDGVDWQGRLSPIPAKLAEADVTNDEPEHADEDDDTDADGPDNGIGHLHHGSGWVPWLAG